MTVDTKNVDGPHGETMELKPGMPLRDVFQALKEQRVPYVVLNDWLMLPVNPMFEEDSQFAKIEILTTLPSVVVQAFGATRVRGSLYAVRPAGKKPMHLVVRKKGENFLPERFETEILHRAVMHGDIVKIPAMRDAAMLFLYRELYHCGNIKNLTQRKVFEELLDERVGRPVVPNETDVQLKYTRL